MDLFAALFEEQDPEKVQRRFLHLLLEKQQVDRGSIWVERDGAYECIEAMGSQSGKVKGLRIDTAVNSVVGWVIREKRMTVAEAGVDERHYRDAEERLSTKSRRILCFPLLLRDGTVYGAVQLIETSQARELRLDREYLAVFQSLVDLGGVALGNALRTRRLERDLARARDAARGHMELVGDSPAFRAALDKARSYAATDFPVCITGESGTGKELAAREVHARSGRRNGPFLVQNCSAIPAQLLESELFGHRKGAFTGADSDRSGLFQEADGGTVFLDEIGDMPVDLQARILRVLQEGEVKPLGENRSVRVDVRVVSATNQDLARAVAAGRFREDLFYRLNVLPLHMPPLREREDDVILLLDWFLRRDALAVGRTPLTPTPATLERLRAHAWPGNVRELENAVKYMVTTAPGPRLRTADLPAPIREPAPATALPPPTGSSAPETRTERPALDGHTWRSLERAYVEHLLEKHRWNVSAAAREAGLKRSTFDYRMRNLGLRKGA